jgi:pantoate--beta-alanine ligase
MQVVTTVAEMRRLRAQMAGSVGLVPTMGYLHEGHLALVRRARADNEHVVVTIFVNPTQFGPQDDYQRYPRDPERDLRLLEQEGSDVVFMPSVEEMYPQGFDAWVEVGEALTGRLEGAARPGHFRGVTTVVAKLFEIVQAQRAYFGQKDGQQLAVIRKMVADLNMGVEVVGLPTVREPDGLAMSSRNVYLSPEERRAVTVLWRSLGRARELFDGGERRADVIRGEMGAVLASEPLARVEYVSVADAETLAELEAIEGPAMVSLAVRIGATRLIDNVIIGSGLSDLTKERLS